VIRRTDGRVMIFEVKGESMREDPVNGEGGRKTMAVREWVDLNPDNLSYEVVFPKNDRPLPDELAPIRAFMGATAASADGLQIRVDRAKIEPSARSGRSSSLPSSARCCAPTPDRTATSTPGDVRRGCSLGLEDRGRSGRAGGDPRPRGRPSRPRGRRGESENWIWRRHILEHARTFYVA